MQPFPNTPEHKHNIKNNKKEKRPKFHINDHVDILTEILVRLDAHSLGVAACVCRLWWSISHNDSIWEHLCFRHLSSSSPPLELRPVVKALGGYKRLYMLCIRPALARLGRTATRWRVWSRDELQLSLSLFCVDYYERLGPRLGGSGTAPASSSLMFLCKPVNV